MWGVADLVDGGRGACVAVPACNDRRGGQCKKAGGYVRNDKWWAGVVYGCWKFILKPWFLRGQDF